MSNKQEELLEKILRELQDIKVIVQENANDINYLLHKEGNEN